MSRPLSRPPVESVELHLDPDGDAQVRELWGRLEEAGCASLARNSYNRPHVTIAAMPHTAGALEALVPQLREAAGRMVGLRLTLTGVALFPHARSVLYAAVLPTEQLLVGHARIHALLETHELEAVETSVPGAWTPHCTLAKRVRTELLGDAMGATTAASWPVTARVARVVRWDGLDRLVETIAE